MLEFKVITPFVDPAFDVIVSEFICHPLVVLPRYPLEAFITPVISADVAVSPPAAVTTNCPPAPAVIDPSEPKDVLALLIAFAVIDHPPIVPLLTIIPDAVSS